MPKQVTACLMCHCIKITAQKTYLPNSHIHKQTILIQRLSKSYKAIYSLVLLLQPHPSLAAPQRSTGDLKFSCLLSKFIIAPTSPTPKERKKNINDRKETWQCPVQSDRTRSYKSTLEVLRESPLNTKAPPPPLTPSPFPLPKMLISPI